MAIVDLYRTWSDKIYVPEIRGKLFCLFLVAGILSFAQKGGSTKISGCLHHNSEIVWYQFNLCQMSSFYLSKCENSLYLRTSLPTSAHASYVGIARTCLT